MAYANKNTLIIYDTLPSIWLNAVNYNAPSNSTQQYDDGFRTLVIPTYSATTQYLGDLYYNSSDDTVTYYVSGKTPATITAEIFNNEYSKYIKRKDDGIDTYLRLATKLRLAKLGGAISDEAHIAIEVALESVRAEIVLGQWKGAKQKLEVVGTSIIGQNMYDEIMGIIDDYIANNY